MALSRYQYNLLTKIMVKHPWLDPDSLGALLFDDCDKDKHRDLIVELVDRITYVEQTHFSKIVNDICSYIVEELGFEEETTQIVAMAGDSSADSSQMMLHMMKYGLRVHGWSQCRFTNRYDHAYKTYKENVTYSNIVLVDEFVGSGQTVLNRVSRIKKQFKNASVNDFEVKVLVGIACQAGLANARSAGIDIKANLEIQKGITDFYNPIDAPEKLELMKQIEQVLSQEYKGRKLPSLGYGEVEALYARESNNVPNSVFPVFWWPIYRDNSKRETILNRFMGDA